LENVINQGLSPLDLMQDDFATSLLTFFENATNINRNSLDDQPVIIHQAGRSFIFQNPGKAYATYIEIYKDGQSIETISLDRVRFVPTSIPQILQGLLDNLTNGPEVVEVPYTLPAEDGDYEIKIRTGRDLGLPPEPLSVLALQSNIVDMATDVFLDIMSFENQNLACAQTLINNFRTFISTNEDFQNFNSVQDVLSFTYDRTLAFITSGENIFFGCNPPNVSISGYLKSIEKKIKWLQWIGWIGHTGNYSMAAYQWFTDEARVDKCYTVNGNQANECNYFNYEGEWYMLWYDEVYNPYNEALITLDANGESTSVLLSSTPGSTNYEDITDSWSYTMTYNATSNTLNLTNNYWNVTNSFPVTNVNDDIFYTNDSSFSIELHRM